MIAKRPGPLKRTRLISDTPDQADRLTPIDPHLYLRGRETIEEDLDRLAKPLHPKRAIYVMHSPPFATQLDLIQGGKPAGSRSIRAFIEMNQPLLTLHGHIHEARESPALTWIGSEKPFRQSGTMDLGQLGTFQASRGHLRNRNG